MQSIKLFSRAAANAAAVVAAIGWTVPGANAVAGIVTDERLLTVHPRADAQPAVSGDLTVFTSERFGDPDIFSVNTATSVVTAVDSSPGAQFQPDIDGTKVVYTDNRFGDFNIFLTDLRTGINSPLTVNPNKDDRPAISGDRVVFTTNRFGTRDVFLVDVGTNIMTPVAASFRQEDAPAIDGDLVAWDAFDGDSFDVMATFVDGTPFVVAGGAANQSNPDVSGDRIVFIEDGDVMLFDVTTQQLTQITDDPIRQNPPLIDGDHIVWTDDRNGNDDVFLFDLVSDELFQLTSDPSFQVLGGIDGNRVVYSDDRFGNADIWQTTFEIERQVAVPEPAVIGLFAIGLVGLGVMVRRRRSAARSG